MPSKQLVIWCFLYFGGMFGSLVHPIYPWVGYLVFYYAPPKYQHWGDSMPDLRYSLIASLALAFALLIAQSNTEPLKKVRNRAAPWLLLFGLNAIIVTQWAIDPVRNWEWLIHLLKLILLYFLIPAAMRTRQHFDLFAAVHVLGATYWGWKAWDNPRRDSGRLLMVGGPDTLADNAAAGHLLTVMPFAVLLLLSADRVWLKAMWGICLAFIVNVFILCNSRGATVGFLVAGLAGLVLVGHGRRMKAMLVGAAGLVLVVSLADTEFIERQQTTLESDNSSADTRITFWLAGIEMMRDNPLGVGARGFHALSPRYLPGLLDSQDRDERSGHNTYTQLGVAWGFQGMAIYFTFMIMTALMLFTVRRRATDTPWFFFRAMTLLVALAGTMSAALFSNRLYGESIYWMCSIAFALYRLQETEQEAREPSRPPVTHEPLQGFHPFAVPSAGGVRAR